MERAQEYVPARAIGVGVLEASLQLACRSYLVLSAVADACSAVRHLCHSRCRTQQVSAYGRRDLLEIDLHIDEALRLVHLVPESAQCDKL